MFHSAALKLTLYYLGIIMAISLIFSVILYRISTNELDRGFRRQPVSFQIIGGGIDGGRPSFEQFRQTQLDETGDRLRTQLVFFNLATLTIGGGLSYLLARRTLEPIEEAMEAQGRFVSDASHELRTPLTAMQTQVEVGLRNPKLKLPEAKELLESTLEEVAKLRNLSNGLLRLTRSNGKDMPKEPVRLSEAIAEAATQLKVAARLKNITLIHATSDIQVLGDIQSLKEVVAILLDNAIKYSPNDTTVTTEMAAIGRQATVTVTDQGQGIKATDLEHIFDRFYRADASRSKLQVEGYGLGLAIAKQLIEAHAGTIEAHSRPGEGATFVLKLPLHMPTA